MNTKILFYMTCLLTVFEMWPGVSYAAYRVEGVGARLDSPFSYKRADQSALKEFGDLSDGVRAIGGPTAVQSDVEEPGDPTDVQFHSYFSHDTVYDSNIFSLANDPRGDLIEVPAVTVGLTRGREGLSQHFAELFYDVSYLDYAEHEKLDRMSHHIRTGYQSTGEKLKWGIQNDLSPLSPQGTRDRREFSGSGNTSTVISTSNIMRFKSAYEWSPKWRLTTDWTHELYDYPEASHGNSEAAARLSQQTHTVAPRLAYQVTAKTAVYVGYQAAVSDYFRGGEFAFKSHAVNTGFVSLLNPKTVFLFESGYKVRDFNQPRFDGGDLFVYRTSLRRQIGNKMDWTLMAGRDLAMNLDMGSQSTTHYVLGTDRTSLVSQLRWELSRSMSIAADAAIGFESVDAPYALMDPETGALEVDEREDVTYSWGLAWRWARSSFDQYQITYRYFDRSSNFRSLEYDNHELTASVILELK